jgi:hypothetical protein
MPVKIRRSKARTAPITDEARAIFKEALALQLRDEHIRGICPSPIGTHCPDCLKYMDLSRELGRLVGVKFWEHSPLRADSEEPPRYMRDNNPYQSELWRRAWALRCELDRGER